jgi:nucleotide-binding universal stress UspA family protein
MITEPAAYRDLAPAQTAETLFRHLLLPIDFSESNLAAARYVRQIAGWGDSHITLLHVRSDVPTENTEILDRLQQILRGLTVQTSMVSGDPANAISQYARDNGVDLIVMPTRGVGAVRRLVLGSVTAKVLQNAGCPVLTLIADNSVPEDAEPHFRHIICAVDLGPDSLRTLRCADALAKNNAASMTILHVNPQLEPVVGVVHDREWCSYLARVLRAEIEKLKREAGVNASVRLAGGEPARTLAEITSELNADLLVIGRSRPRGVLGRLRTHAYSIICQASCPVLSV